MTALSFTPSMGFPGGYLMSTPGIFRVLGLTFVVGLIGFATGCGSDSPERETEDSGIDATDAGEGGGVKPDAGSEDAAPDVECVAQGCDELGLECGTADDGCGNELDCGDPCKSPEICGGIEPNMCGCLRFTCDDLASEKGSKACGEFSDGCGGIEQCGDSCDEGQSCGALEDNVCGCRPNLAACGENAECGTADDGCGGTIQCGEGDSPCGAAKACNDDRQCECKPAKQLCKNRCGGVQIIDGCEVDCGPCDSGASCESGATCTQCACGGGQICGDDDTCCAADSDACDGTVCGEVVDSCGRVVQCDCGGGLECAQGMCVEPLKAALVGRYALRNVSFASTGGAPNRTLTFTLVRIALNEKKQVTMVEQACGVQGWLDATSTDPAAVAVEITPEMAEAVGEGDPRVLVLPSLPDFEGTLPEGVELPGGEPVDWFLPERPRAENTLGWRRTVSYCPAGSTFEKPLGPDVNHPDYARTQFSEGGAKPWLPSGQKCRCPHEEAVARCSELKGAELDKCRQRVLNEIPYHIGAGGPEQVTDCRVTDDDSDGRPGVTLSVPFGLARLPDPTDPEGKRKLPGIVGSVSATSVRVWGKVDPKGRHHWGVSEDVHGENYSSFVMCQVGSGSFVDAAEGAVCGPQSPVFCPGIIDSKPSNRTDLVSLRGVKPSSGGEWTCEKLLAEQTAVFVVDGEKISDGSDNAPTSVQCK